MSNRGRCSFRAAFSEGFLDAGSFWTSFGAMDALNNFSTLSKASKRRC